MRTVLILVIIGTVIFIFSKRYQKTKFIGLPIANSIDEALEFERSKSIIAINELIQKKLGDRDYCVLSKPEMYVLAVDWLQSDVNNGGFFQYYNNSFSELAHEALEGLREIKATNVAKIVEKSFSVFPNSKVPKEQVERQDFLKTSNDKIVEVLERLDNEFFCYPDDIDALLLEYVRNNKDDFKTDVFI